MARNAFAVDGRVRIGGSFFRRGERGVFALGAAGEMEIRARRDAFGFGVTVGRYDRYAEDAVGLRQRRRRLEMLPVSQHRARRVIIGEMMGEREAHADGGGKL